MAISTQDMSFYHTAYRPEVIRNAVLLHVGYVPIYILALVARKNSFIYLSYKNTIIFSGAVQFLLSLPYTLFNTWFAIFVSEEIETTEMMCTLTRMGLSVLNYISYNALTAVSISRVLTVVFDHPCDIRRNLGFLTLASLPILALLAKAIASGGRRQNPVCGPLTFFDNEQQLGWIFAWNLYIFAIPLIAVILNAITACYLIKHRIGRLSSGSKTRRVNELHVALALLLQSLVPAITMSSKGYRSIVEIYAVQSPWWLKEPMDVLSFLTTGLNMTISMACIRAFREATRELFCGRTGDQTSQLMYSQQTPYCTNASSGIMMSNSSNSFPPSMSLFRIWFWLPVCAVLIPSTVLHIKLLFVIRARQREGHCKSLFYHLFMVQLFLIYLYLAGQLVVKDQPQGGDFLLSTNGGFFAKFYYYGTVYFFLHVQVWGVVVQSFNRFVAICAPDSRVRYFLELTPEPLWCLINTLIPFAMLFRQILQDSTYFIVDKHGNVAIYSPPHVIESNATQATIVTAMGTGFSAVCYAFVLRKLITIKTKFTNNLAYRREKMFTLVGFSLFLSLCAMTAYYVIVKIAALTNGDLVLIVRHIYILPVMLLTFVNPWMLIITDRKLRKRMLANSSSSFPPGVSQIRIWFWLPVSAVLIPSTLLHIKMLFIIRMRQREGHCKSLFYRLFIVQSILELFLMYLYLAGQFLIKDQPQGGNFLLSTKGGFFPKLYYYGMFYYFLHVQVWGVIVQSFNCFLCICAPESTVRYFSEQTPDIAWCLINTLIPFVMLFREILQDGTCFIIKNGNVVIYNPPHVIESNTTQAIIVTAIGSVLSSVCYAFVLRKLIVAKNQFSNKPDYRREKTFTLVGFALFLSLCAMTGFYLMVNVAARTNGNLLLISYLYILPVMLLTFVNPWMLAMTDRKLRRLLLCH